MPGTECCLMSEGEGTDLGISRCGGRLSIPSLYSAASRFKRRCQGVSSLEGLLGRLDVRCGGVVGWKGEVDAEVGDWEGSGLRPELGV